ncbi:transposase [Streptomyces sp. NPDC096030]|uniref:transposase n=1 Tax=Streptomyces sp. NPDC096030 TaxID=3155423 RepID=UPI00332C67C4
MDAVRPGAGGDETAVTAAQLREAGQVRDGDLAVLMVLGAGYGVTRLAFLLAGLPVELPGRMRSERVLYFPPPPQPPGKAGRKPGRGAEFKSEDTTWPVPAHTTTSATSRYGQAVARSWDRLHPLLSRRSAWADHPAGGLPVIPGTVIRLQAGHLPGDRDPKPVWL